MSHSGYESRDPKPREREDVNIALRKMNESFEHARRPLIQRLLNFQVFVSILLIVLVVLTSASFTFSMRSERDARIRSEERAIRFETHVENILQEVRDSQREAHQERREIYEELIDIHEEVVSLVRSALARLDG